MRIARRWSWLVALIIACLVALAAVDALLGLVYRTDTTAGVSIISPRSGTTHRAIVVFPGYMMPGTILGKAFAQHVADDDALVLVDYAERGVNVQQIYDNVMVALRTLKPVELRIYGASMGGMVGKLFLDQYRKAGAPYGKVLLVLDSAPAEPNEIKRPACLFSLSCWYRGGPLSTAVWAAVSECMIGPPIEDDASHDLVRTARHFGMWVGMPAATSQACFISGFSPLNEKELVDIAKQVVYLHGYSPEDDPLVRISESVKSWRKAFPNLIVITIQGRAGRWHLPLIERPRETVKALIAEYRVSQHGLERQTISSMCQNTVLNQGDEQ